MTKSLQKKQRSLDPDSEVLFVEIIGELCDLNTYINKERTNRFIGAKVKKNETARCQWAFKNAPIFDSPVIIRFYWFTKDLKKDPDNISFAKKFILDAMVKEAVLPNDGQKNIKGFSDSFSVDKRNPRIEITIEELED